MTIKELQVTLSAAISLIGEDAQVYVDDTIGGDMEFTPAVGWFIEGTDNKDDSERRRFILR
jgi:hypothetical protein